MSKISIKDFILKGCYCLSVTKDELIQKAKLKETKEILNELVFIFNAPWLTHEHSFISVEDYNRIEKIAPNFSQHQRARLEFLALILLNTEFREDW